MLGNLCTNILSQGPISMGCICPCLERGRAYAPETITPAGTGPAWAGREEKGGGVLYNPNLYEKE